jgi:hypothetical protein
MFNPLRWLRQMLRDIFGEISKKIFNDLPPADQNEIMTMVYYKAARRRGAEPTPLNHLSRFNQLSKMNQDIAKRWIEALAERTLRAQGIRPLADYDVEVARQEWMDLYDKLAAKQRQAILDQDRLIKRVVQQQGERAGNLLSTLFLFEFHRNGLVQISRLLDELRVPSRSVRRKSLWSNSRDLLPS